MTIWYIRSGRLSFAIRQSPLVFLVVDDRSCFNGEIFWVSLSANSDIISFLYV